MESGSSSWHGRTDRTCAQPILRQINAQPLLQPLARLLFGHGLRRTCSQKLSITSGDSPLQTALALIAAILVLSLSNGSVLAQTVDQWRWLFSLHMLDERTGWAVGAEGGSGAWSKGAVGSVMRTTDGGLHWKDVTPHTPPGQHFVQGVGFVRAFSPLSASATAFLDLPTPDGRNSSTPVIFHTADGGQTWTSATTSVGWLMDFINPRDGWLVSGEDVFRSTDGGKTWTRVGSAKFPRYPYSITFLNATTGWIVSNTVGGNSLQTYLFVTRDGGHTWQQKKLPLPLKLINDAPNLVAKSPTLLSAQDGVLPVVYGTAKDAGVFFWLTHNGGATWTPTTLVSLPGSFSGSRMMPGYRASSFADVSHGWVTDGYALHMTSDGGRRWTRRLPSPRFERPMGELEFISPRIGWATGEPLDKPFLSKTLDGGRTWTSVPYTILRR